MILSKRALGISLGLVWGLTVLLGTWWLVIIGSAGATISKLHKFYFGYSVSWGGGIIGLIWGFIDGFIIGFLIAWIYNIASSYFKKPNEL
jgi:hypothetical protein